MNAARFARRLLAPAAFALVLCVAATPLVGEAAFGVAEDPNFYTVNTGGGLIFKIRRTDNGSNSQSAGDIASLLYLGVEYQNQSRGSQINGGCDYLYQGTSDVTVSAEVIQGNYAKITVQAGSLTHYYMAKKGLPHIYMGTYFTAQPTTIDLVRYIVRIPARMLPQGPEPSDIRNNVKVIEAGDIFALENGQTRSKHYSNQRFKDWFCIGATSNRAGLWMVRNNVEGSSGGPFYRSLMNQCGSDQEITYIINYGMCQTEAFRTGILNTYVLVFTRGTPPPRTIDTKWFSGMGLTGYVPGSGRGTITGAGVEGRDPKYAYTVVFANSSAQYWTTVVDDGSFRRTGMLPGDYAMTVYKNELGVHWGNATVTAGGTTEVPAITITADPSSTTPLWRIGDWDGTPSELLNGDKVTTMHPSDVRIKTWSPGPYIVGSSSPETGFPCYQWKDVNGTQAVEFDLDAGQIAPHTVRVGITCAYAGARPKVAVNSWNARPPGASNQPETRSLTVGTYRGNNTMFTFEVPADAFVAGKNTLWISPVSGTTSTGFLSAGYSLDCVDLY